MNSTKTLVFKHLDTKKVLKLNYEDGICITPDTLKTLIEDIKSYTWDSIATTGNTLSHLMVSRPKHVKKVAIHPSLLGIQSVAAAKVVATVESKKSSSASANLDEMKKLAAENKTLMDASKILNIPYPSLYVTAKKNGIVFAKGKKGRKKS